MAGFIKEETKKLTPSVPKDFRHALCVGETGCGKTTSFILPNIQDRMKNDYGMLIIDFKGNLHSQVKVLAEQENRLEDIFEIGVPWGSKINIFKNISRSAFISTLDEVNGKDGERFWITSAINIAGQIYDALSLIDNIQTILRGNMYLNFNYELSTLSFNEILSNFGSFETFLNKCSKVIEKLNIPELVRLRRDGISENNLHLIYQFKTELFSVYKRLYSFYKEIDTDNPASGSGGVFFSVKNIMNTFNQTGLDGKHSIKSYLESGKIVILRSESYDENVTRAIMNILYKQLLGRNSDKHITLFIDEFHRTVSANNLPYIDLFREMNVELIAAMQNIEQLENSVSKEKCSEFLGNVLHNFYYANHIENSMKTFEFTLNGKKAEAKPIFISKVELYTTQIKWQNFSGNPLPKGWIFHRPDGYKRAIILNVKTDKRKYFYILEREDEKLKMALKNVYEYIEPIKLVS